jgi:hypothetical protein
MHCYCTLFDKNYLSRGLTLYSSLQRQEPGVKVVMLCLDSATRDALAALSLADADLILLEELESYDPALRKVRGARLPVEYYFTCKPALMRYIALHSKNVSRITYLDSDLFCFSDPTMLAAEFPRATVILTPHRFPAHLHDREQYGLFNAGWVSASTDEEGIQFVEWWRERCLEWCELKVVGEKFADQKYLNQVADAFPHALALPHNGVNTGPWRLANIRIESCGDKVFVDGQPLIFYHFHGLRQIFGNWYDSGLHEYRVPLSSEIRKLIYEPYMIELRAAEERLQRLPEGITRNLASRRVRRGLVDSLRYARKILGVFMSRTAITG